MDLPLCSKPRQPCGIRRSLILENLADELLVEDRRPHKLQERRPAATHYDGMSEYSMPRCSRRLSDLYLEAEPRLGIEISFGHAENVRLHH
jgi:hypothetical protein